MIIAHKQSPISHPSLFINDTKIKNPSLYNNLGLNLANTDSWDEHVKSISEKSWSRFDLLSNLAFRETLGKIVRYLQCHTSSFGI